MDGETKSRRTATSEWIAIISGIITIVTFIVAIGHQVLNNAFRWLPGPFEQLVPRDPDGGDVIGLIVFGAVIAAALITRAVCVFIDSDHGVQDFLIFFGFMATECWAIIVGNTLDSNLPWFWDPFWYVTALTILSWLSRYARRFLRSS